jgi:phosphate transport system permease protein
VLAAVVATLPLVFILTHILLEGARSINLDFFIRAAAPVGQTGGGMAHAIVGTLIVVGTAVGIGLPIGIGAGLYLAEQRAGMLANTVRFLSDVLNGLPSIVMGLFVYQFVVLPMGHHSAFAGGVALAAILVPLVTRTTEEMVRTVPVSLREAALALGYARWRTSLSIVLRTSMAGIVTGVLVAVARIAGETAPVLFTVFGSSYISTALDKPIQVLPLQIYVYATSGFN